MGATQASAGVLAPYIETHEGSPLLALTVRSLQLFDQFVERVSSDAHTPILYHRSGTLEAAMDEGEMLRLRGIARTLTALGVPALLLDGAAVRDEEPHLSEDAVGGLLIGVHGFVGAVALTHAIAGAACARGARVIEASHVRGIARTNGNLTLETDQGALTGNAVVLAAGSWSGDIPIAGQVNRPPVRPVRGQLLTIGWRGAPLRRVTWSSRCYLVPWDDATVLVGATVEEAGFDERVTVAGARDLLDGVCDIVPHAWTAGFLGARVGLRPATPDNLPIIGRSSVVPNLMYATGHYRNGVLLAPLTAKIVADAMLEHVLDLALASVSPARFGL
jgi:glycine oxidase